MRELQAEVYGVLVEILRGLNRTPDADQILVKLIDEVGELVRANGEEETEGIMPVLDEAADVAICLLSFAAAKGFDLEAAIRAKLEVNKRRRWAVNPDGTISHVRPSASG